MANTCICAAVLLRRGLRYNMHQTEMRFGGLVSSSNAIEADEIEVLRGAIVRCCNLHCGGTTGWGRVIRLRHVRPCFAGAHLSWVAWAKRAPGLVISASHWRHAAHPLCLLPVGDINHTSFLMQVEVDADIVWTTQLRIR